MPDMRRRCCDVTVRCAVSAETPDCFANSFREAVSKPWRMENEEVPDVMTASYSEITNSIPEEEVTSVRRRPNRFPYNLEGTVSMDGDMTHFIAENLEHKIKLSSPIAKSRESPKEDSHDSTPSTSGFQRPGGFLLPSEIDSNVLNDVEMEAQYLAASVDNLTENLCNLLHSISSITADNVEVYKNSVSKLTDCMDANIKNMYTIMAKTEEISNAIKPTKQLMNRIREIKRLVDMLENAM